MGRVYVEDDGRGIWMMRRMVILGSQLNSRIYIPAEFLGSAASNAQNIITTYVWVGGFLPRCAEKLHRRRCSELTNLPKCQTVSAPRDRKRVRTFSSASFAYMM